MATWVDLSSLYVKKTGDTISGALTVTGALTANGGLKVKYNTTTYDVGAQLSTLNTNVATAQKYIGRGTAVPSGTSVATHIYIRTT